MATYWSDMCDRPTCLYRLHDAKGRLLYVGISKNPRGRFSKHHARPWWPDVADIELTWFPNRTRALDAERHAIRDEDPVHNLTSPRVECC